MSAELDTCTFGLNPECAHLIAKFRSNPPQWLLDMRTENQKETQ